MVIKGLLKELGATYEARRIEDDELVFGVGIIKVDENKSYLIQSFETNDYVDCAPAMAYYTAVKTDSIVSYNKYDSKKETEVELEVEKYRIKTSQIAYLCSLHKLDIDKEAKRELLEVYYECLKQGKENVFMKETLIVENKPNLYLFLKTNGLTIEKVEDNRESKLGL